MVVKGKKCSQDLVSVPSTHVTRFTVSCTCGLRTTCARHRSRDRRIPAFVASLVYFEFQDS